MTYDFNVLERCAKELMEANQIREAMKIYFFMADGDPSLDGGYLGERLGECYEALGELAAAKYWYGRAVEENRLVRPKSVEAREKLEKPVSEEFPSIIAAKRRDGLIVRRAFRGLGTGPILDARGSQA